MRDIKFRAWDEDRQKMITSFLNGGTPFRTPALLQTEEEEGDIGRVFCGDYKENEDWQEPILMQFTGLKDKNGKEIYEGDIMMVLDRDWPSGEGDPKEYMKSIAAICEVVFETGCFMLKKIKGGDYCSWDLSKERGRDLFEVIGNTYQNPDLIFNPSPLRGDKQ